MESCTWVMLLLIVTAYLSGAVPWGLIIVRHLKNIDVRSIGSGNIGATNVRRAAGTPAALLVLLLDMLKGALPVLALRLLGSSACSGQWQWAGALGTLAAIGGHMFPVYLMFKPSGKGVATALGCYLVLSPWAAFGAITVFGAIAAVTRKVSLGSLAGTVTLLPGVWVSTHDWVLTFSAALSTGLIILRHKDNIRRLLHGSEPSLKDRPNDR